ncbi:MAG: hypothetical protein HPY75_14375 [Actinobacteria bacterium]|nr:hypothetical protein [Actinomycetota bacterium]
MPSVCADGRYVAFASAADNLVPGDTNGACDVFRKDLVTGKTVRCSTDSAGSQSAGGFSWNSLNSALSADGRYVAFTSAADNLVSGDTNGAWDVFRKDLVTGEILRCNNDSAGGEATGGNSDNASLSADGRYVAFTSAADNLVPGDTNSMGDVFRKDLVTGQVLRCNTDSSWNQATGGYGDWPSISADGRYVAFEANATNLVPGDTNGEFDIFRKELSAPYRFYFAEGYTGEGFQEYLCLGNPYGDPTDVKVTYLFRNGTTKEETWNVAGNSRVTVNVNQAAGADAEVSIVCESEDRFIAERPMYFDYTGSGSSWTGGHDVVGATSPALNWYFAEGYTGPGFEEWICVLNPGDLDASLTFRFQTQEEGEKVVAGFSVPAHSRGSFKANQLLGGAFQTSLKLESDHPVVAERPMYFSYSGTGGYGWTGGHCVMGTPLLASSYYFAEGTTRSGFEEWLTLQNPGTEDITVHAVYNLGEGDPVERDYLVPAGKRSTVLVNSDTLGVGAEQDVSVRLTCPDPFLAERPMYFSYPGLGNWGWTGGHCVIGAREPASTWFFAEGYTGQRFEEWLCVQNPGGTKAEVAITYYPELGGEPKTTNHTVEAGTRYTVPVNVDAGADLSISARLTSTQPVIVERPMYFNFDGAWSGGHDVVGYAP